LHQAVEALVSTRAEGAEPFDFALESLEEAWGDVQQRDRHHREKAVRALLQAEQRNLLAEKVAKEMRARPDVAGAPREIVSFVAGPWAQVMAQARLMDPSGSEDPGGYAWVVHTVLWSVQPALVARVAGQQRLLKNRIDEGLASIDHLRADTQRWQNLLAVLRDLALSTATGSALQAFEPEPPPERVDTWLAPLEMHESGFVPDAAIPLGSAGLEADALPPADLVVGSYVDLLADGWERWQLTWSSPHGLLFMFTHASGSTRSMTRRKLQQMLAQGTLRLVSAHPVVDGALDAVAQAAWRNSL